MFIIRDGTTIVRGQAIARFDILGNYAIHYEHI